MTSLRAHNDNIKPEPHNTLHAIHWGRSRVDIMAKRTIGYALILITIALFGGACSLDQPTPTLPISAAVPSEAATRVPAETGSDLYEPNDTRKEATVMQRLTVSGYISHAEDVDIFRTPATYGGYLLDFTVELYDLPADYDVYVYDSADREVARSTNRGLAPEHITYHSGPRTGNSYWLKIVGANGASDPGRPYRLRFTMNPGTPTPTAVPTWMAAPTHTPSPTRTPTALPTATQASTPASKVELPIGALAHISYDRQLLVRDPAGATCAISKGGIAHSPAWSPDGTRLAFSYQADDRAAAELRIYDFQTGDQTTAWTDPDSGPPHADPIREIAWSPSGRYLAFSQGCCPLGPVSIWDLEAAALAGYRGAYSMFWGLDEDVLTLTLPQPVGKFIPIGSGDSTSIALVRPYDVSPTVVLTGTAATLYHARAWLSSDELAYMRLDMGDEEKETEHTWLRTRIVDGEAVDHSQLDAPPLRHDNDPLQEHLLPWLPAVTVGDYDWSADGTWAVFSASQDREERWRIYAFHWAEGRLVGPFAEGFDLALAPVRTAWRCPE